MFIWTFAPIQVRLNYWKPTLSLLFQINKPNYSPHFLAKMTFTYEDKVIIRYLRQKHGHGAIRIVKDHPEREWKLGGVKDLLARIDATGSIERAEGSGRPRSVRDEQTLETIEELILSQEDAPGTHKTPAEISDYLGCSERIVIYAVHDDLNLKALKKIKCKNLSIIDCEKRLQRCNKLLHKYTDAVLQYAVFLMKNFLKFNNTITTKTIVFT